MTRNWTVTCIAGGLCGMAFVAAATTDSPLLMGAAAGVGLVAVVCGVIVARAEG